MDEIRQFLTETGLIRHPWVQALVILVVAWGLAQMADWVLRRGFAKLTRRTRTELDDQILAILHRPVRDSVLLFGLWLVTLRLPLPVRLEHVTEGVIQTVAVLIWLVFGFRFTSLLLPAIVARQERYRLLEARTLPLFNNLAKVFLVGGAAYFVFLAWNIDIAAWLTSAGIIGIVVGFAARDTLANLFAGVFISADAPYKVGDYIVLDTGERGRVTQVGIRSTRLLTRDDVEITIPNAVIASSKIVNESGGPWERERIRIPVSVAYGSDVDQVRAALMAVAQAEEHVCAEPEPRVRFRAFGDSGLAFELLCWIDEPGLRGRMLDSLNTAVYKRFAAESIEIPYPKRDVYVRQMPSGE